MTNCKYSQLVFIATIAMIPYHALARGLPVHDRGKPPVKTTYWEENIQTLGATQSSGVTFYTRPGGLMVSVGILHGKFQLLNFRAATGDPIWTFGRPHVLSIGWNAIFRRTQYLVKKFGLAGVEKDAGWPVGTPGFVEAFIPTQPRDVGLPGRFLQSTKGLTETKTVEFRGHPCEVMSSTPTKFGKMGNQKSIVYIDTHTHFIWREDKILIPRPGSIYAPQRSTTYVVFNRQVSHIPARCLKFPPGTRYILPTCMGHITTPPGAVRVNQPPDSAFFGYSFAWRLNGKLRIGDPVKSEPAVPQQPNHKMPKGKL